MIKNEDTKKLYRQSKITYSYNSDYSKTIVII